MTYSNIIQSSAPSQTSMSSNIPTLSGLYTYSFIHPLATHPHSPQPWHSQDSTTSCVALIAFTFAFVFVFLNATTPRGCPASEAPRVLPEEQGPQGQCQVRAQVPRKRWMADDPESLGLTAAYRPNPAFNSPQAPTTPTNYSRGGAHKATEQKGRG